MNAHSPGVPTQASSQTSPNEEDFAVDTSMADKFLHIMLRYIVHYGLSTHEMNSEKKLDFCRNEVL
jgi:hypothetical protein